jgi:hypothetical protein
MAQHALWDNSPLPPLRGFGTIPPTPTLTGYEMDGSSLVRSADCSFGVQNVDCYVSWYTRPTAGGVIALRTKSSRTCSNRRMMSAE